jgi:hypothetical protein
MNTTKPIIKRLKARGFFLLPTVFCLLCAQRAEAQATTLVKPRQYTLFQGWLTNGQAITTNAALPGQTIGVFTNTLTPYSGSHPLGLAALMSVTNSNPGASNITIIVYPAYDNYGGNTNGINESYGTNFATVPILTWTPSYKTNATVLTNIASVAWEPATAMGYTISNGSSSNVYLTFIQSQSP